MSTVRSPPPISHLRDADMQAAPAALVRAAGRAREVAARSGTPLIVSENGRVVEKAVTGPDREPREARPTPRSARWP